MNRFQRYLLSQFVPVCLVALIFFILILELVDLFANLWRYLANDASFLDVCRVLLLYVPKCISYSMPIAVLFAASYTIGNMYAQNELTAIFSSGYPLFALTLPLLVAGLLLSAGMFFFEDRIVIHTLVKKNELNRILTRSDTSLSNANIVVMDDSGTVIYTAQYYRDSDQSLHDLFIAVRDEEGNLAAVISSRSARWDGKAWLLSEPTAFAAKGSSLSPMDASTLVFDEEPELFRRNVTSVDELPVSEAGQYIENLRRASQPYAEALANYYRRFSFPLTIFVVLFFSVSLAGRFKKNILLMSLLLSLTVAVSYYVLQMVTMLLAKWEYISPAAGAWLPLAVFGTSAFGVLKTART